MNCVWLVMLLGAVTLPVGAVESNAISEVMANRSPSSQAVPPASAKITKVQTIQPRNRKRLRRRVMASTVTVSDMGRPFLTFG